MKVFVIGSGGREHAIAKALYEDKNVKEVISLPGNPGTELIGRNINIDINNLKEIKAISKAEEPDLVVIGPEIPLSIGMADLLRYEGFKVFGPNMNGARIETDKSLTKNILFEMGIPTAKYEEVDNINSLKTSLNKFSSPYVIKASGLAGGKGVYILDSIEKAKKIGEKLLSGELFGESGKKIIVEEFLTGREASFFFVTDGKKSFPLLASKDYKKAYDGDKGGNTGGMGAIASVENDLIEKVEDSIMLPLLEYLSWKNIRYEGVVFIGCMIVNNIPFVLEFNCRFGDPETQAIFPLINEGFFHLLYSTASSSLENTISFKDKKSMSVVIASENYPNKPNTGNIISGVEKINSSDMALYYAGVKKTETGLINSGGRVFALNCIGDHWSSIKEKLYSNIDNINFTGSWYRKDIGL